MRERRGSSACRASRVTTSDLTTLLPQKGTPVSSELRSGTPAGDPSHWRMSRSTPSGSETNDSCRTSRRRSRGWRRNAYSDSR